jgi:hypothetical protein
MRRWYVNLIIILVSCLIAGGVYVVLRPHQKPVVAVSSTPRAVVPKDCSVSDSGVVSAVNQYRSEAGLSPVSIESRLDKMADFRAEQQNGSIDNHDGFRPYLASNWPVHPQIAEVQNLLVGCNNSLDRVGYFKFSDTHWNALMLARYDSIGVGFVGNELVIELGDLR